MTAIFHETCSRMIVTLIRMLLSEEVLFLVVRIRIRKQD